MDHILENLDEEKRAAYVLFEIEQLSMAEVADALGCPLQTAYKRYYAARDFVHARVRRDLTMRRIG